MADPKSGKAAPAAAAAAPAAAAAAAPAAPAAAAAAGKKAAPAAAAAAAAKDGGGKKKAAPAAAPSHKLQHEWSIWEHRKQGKHSQDYAAAMYKLCSFGTVEDFWRYYNSIPSPSKIFFDAAAGGFKRFADGRHVDALSMFKKGVRPEWEDSANIMGGEFMCRKVSHDPAHIDHYWENLLLGLIGETIDAGDEITGCRVVDKSSRNTTVYRLEFWFRTRGVDEKLKQRLNACLQLNAPTKRGLVWEYREHSKHISSTLPGR